MGTQGGGGLGRVLVVVGLVGGRGVLHNFGGGGLLLRRGAVVLAVMLGMVLAVMVAVVAVVAGAVCEDVCHCEGGHEGEQRAHGVGGGWRRWRGCRGRRPSW